MIISKKVEVTWARNNCTWYKSKGYLFTKLGDKFLVSINDLREGNKVLIEVICDCELCNNKIIKKIQYSNYVRSIKNNGKYYCKDCSIKYLTVKKATKTKLKKGISFGEYLINSFGENAIEEYWSNLNIINPFEINYHSNKFVWIKCQDKNYHDDYSTTCNNFINGNRCPYCSGKKIHKLDSLGCYLEINNLLYLWSDKNKKSPYDYLPNSNKKVYWKCPEGKHDNYKRYISNSNKYKFRCPDCQFSEGEEITNNYLLSNNINFLPQKEFEGLIGLGGGNLSYDFYLQQYKLLIEIQGIQHEKPIDFQGKGKKYAEEQFKKQLEHDKRKREYAKNHNIKLLEIWYYDFDKIEKILDAILINRNNI